MFIEFEHLIRGNLVEQPGRPATDRTWPKFVCHVDPDRLGILELGRWTGRQPLPGPLRCHDRSHHHANDGINREGGMGEQQVKRVESTLQAQDDGDRRSQGTGEYRERRQLFQRIEDPEGKAKRVGSIRQADPKHFMPEQDRQQAEKVDELHRKRFEAETTSQIGREGPTAAATSRLTQRHNLTTQQGPSKKERSNEISLAQADDVRPRAALARWRNFRRILSRPISDGCNRKK